METDRRTLLVLALIITLGGALAYVALTPIAVQGAVTGGTSTAEAETPYGESLNIELTSDSSTSGAASWLNSWMASYQDSDSQNVYTVNSTYKSQEQVTLQYSASVTHSNVESITITAKIKAIDKGTPANFHEYALATAKALSGASPISDSGSTVPTILAHLTSVGGSTTSETVQYQIYAQVSATGSISGDTLTATIAYTPFGTLVYTQSSESSAADVTPTVSVASFLDDALGLPGETIMNALVVMTVAASWFIIRRD